MPKRERRSNAEWQDIIERQEQNGLTGVTFCLQEGIYAKTFYRQRKMLRHKGLMTETETIYPGTAVSLYRQCRSSLRSYCNTGIADCRCLQELNHCGWPS